MSVALFLELMDYEGSEVYRDILIRHIDDIKFMVSQCESLKQYDPTFTKAKLLQNNTTDTRELEEAEYSSVGEKFLSKIKTKLGLAKRYIDNCNGIDGDEDLTYQLQFLFSLSVCNDHLLWLMQQDELKIGEYSSFFNSIGMTVIPAPIPYYHPFYHEIYRVDDEIKVGSSQQICIKKELYPMIMFGDLQFSRAGVIIFNHPDVDKDLVENSTIYFTNRRENRECDDLSHGWGHNSRWRTDFVRNYETEQYWRFNVDGEIDLADSDAYKEYSEQFGSELSLTITLPMAKELLVNRYFIHPDKPLSIVQEDHFPYDWRLDMAKKDFNYIDWKNFNLIDQ